MSDDLGNRMKGYENITRNHLPPRTNLFIRIDGRAFHSYTRNCAKPFDDDLMAAMDQTATALCEEIQGAKLAYVQSDEINIWATSYDKIGSEAWFGGNIQKIASVGASIATARFNQVRDNQQYDNRCQVNDRPGIAHFDARVFTIPELPEVANMLLWRCQDASRNSVQMYARSLYSHKELEGKNLSELHDLIHAKGLNWNNLAPRYKRGRLVKRVEGMWQIVDLDDFSFDYWFYLVKAAQPKNED